LTIRSLMIYVSNFL